MQIWSHQNFLLYCSILTQNCEYCCRFPVQAIQRRWTKPSRIHYCHSSLSGDGSDLFRIITCLQSQSSSYNVGPQSKTMNEVKLDQGDDPRLIFSFLRLARSPFVYSQANDPFRLRELQWIFDVECSQDTILTSTTTKYSDNLHVERITFLQSCIV